jgi:hypothetical protein
MKRFFDRVRDWQEDPYHQIGMVIVFAILVIFIWEPFIKIFPPSLKRIVEAALFSLLLADGIFFGILILQVKEIWLGRGFGQFKGEDAEKIGITIIIVCWVALLIYIKILISGSGQ